MHFCVVYVYFFHLGQRSSKGSKGQIRFSMGRKKSTISNCKNNSANVFYMDRYTKVSTVTPVIRPTVKGSKVKKGQISKIIDMHGLSSNSILMIPVTL